MLLALLSLALFFLEPRSGFSLSGSRWTKLLSLPGGRFGGGERSEQDVLELAGGWFKLITLICGSSP